MKDRTKAAAFLLLAAFIVSMAFYFKNGLHYMDADLASEMILANLQNREGTLLTGSWFYSSELRLISPVPAYQLGLALFGSWHLARTFAVGLMLLLMILCFLYMAKPCRMHAGGLLTAVVLALPFSAEYADFVAYGSYYTMHLCLFFLQMGLLFRMDRKKGRLLRFLLILLLGFWSGLGGIRLLMMFAAPLALALFADALLSIRGKDTLKSCLPALPLPMLAAAGAMMLFMVIGFLANVKLLAPLLSYDSHMETPVIIPEAEIAFYQVTEAASFFGLRSATQFMSLRGLLSLAAIFLTGLCFAAPVLRLRRWSALALPERITALFALCAILLGIIVNMITGNYVSHYYMAGLIMSLVCTDQLLYDANLPKILRSGFAVLLVGVFALQAGIFVREDMPSERNNEEKAAAWLQKEGYTQGYATFWHGATLTNASSGAIEVWVLDEATYTDDWKQLNLNQFLQEKRHLTEDPAGAVFVYLSPEEETDPPAWADQAHLAKRASWGAVYVWESAASLRASAGV